MATTLVDTSALYAFLDADDRYNARAISGWERLLASEDLLTHNYVLLETSALAQARLGAHAVRDLHDELVPTMTVVWVNEDIHEDAVALVAADERRMVSLVDRVSFLVMRRHGISRAFTFDSHFAAEGFEPTG